MTGNIPLLRVRGLPFTAEEDQIAEFFDEYNINCIKLIKRNGECHWHVVSKSNPTTPFSLW